MRTHDVSRGTTTQVRLLWRITGGHGTRVLVRRKTGDSGSGCKVVMIPVSSGFPERLET